MLERYGTKGGTGVLSLCRAVSNPSLCKYHVIKHDVNLGPSREMRS